MNVDLPPTGGFLPTTKWSATDAKSNTIWARQTSAGSTSNPKISVNGSRDSGPLRLGVPVVDMTAGANMVIGILLALYARERTGAGQHIDVTLYDSGLALTHPHAPNWFLSGKTPGLSGNDNPNISPYSLYRTRRSALFIAVGNDLQFGRMCEIIGMPQLARDPRFAVNASRVVNNTELTPIIETAIVRSDFAIVHRNHADVAAKSFDWNLNWLCVLLNEADVMASASSKYGPNLGNALAQEWQLIGFPPHAIVSSLEGRNSFLKQVVFSSPASLILGLNQKIEEEIRTNLTK